MHFLEFTFVRSGEEFFEFLGVLELFGFCETVAAEAEFFGEAFGHVRVVRVMNFSEENTEVGFVGSSGATRNASPSEFASPDRIELSFDWEFFVNVFDDLWEIVIDADHFLSYVKHSGYS